MEPAQVRSLFLKALDLSPVQRAEFLADPQISPETREELLAMLRADQGSETYLRNTVSAEESIASGIGERFGAFQTSALLGRGGMGSVFRAERIDGELIQTVAIKVVDRAWFDPYALERFRQERQFLAGLLHPHIARLIDGGTRSDGIAYLVMEYVDGLRLDEYCDQHNLSIPDRLRLFLPLCEAVDYAHQKLIIHRDLKPSNVLVTDRGEPKLLDFGIAKALDANPGFATQTLLLTPDFASPEQARGEEVTTATDVYGLGAVLYFLLTGRAPHATTGRTAEEVRRAVCETPPARPGAIRAELKGDLENILLRALHGEPQRRYHSARELAEEIENYLSHRPVRATPDGWAYRTKRFVQRHTFASLAAVVAALAVAAGTGVSLYEAHRAQQRFNQVRELANRFIFDFEASIRATPGTLAARRMVTATARQYLENLAADANRDANLKRELSRSYSLLSRAERTSGESALGIQHLKKAIQLLRELKDDCCGPVRERAYYVDYLVKLASYQIDTGAPQESLASSGEAVRAARAWLERSPGAFDAGKTLVNGLRMHGEMLRANGRTAEARDTLADAVKRGEALWRQRPSDDEIGDATARSGAALADVLGVLGETQTGLDAQRNAEHAIDQLLQRHPENVPYRTLKVSVVSSREDFLRTMAERDPALRPRILEASEEAYSLASANARANPGDVETLDYAAVMTAHFANRLFEAKKAEEALARLKEEGVLVDQLIAKEPTSERNLYLKADNQLTLGYDLTELGRWPEAVAALTHADFVMQQIVKKGAANLDALDTRAGILMLLTKAQRNLGRLDLAREHCREALSVAAELTARNRDAKSPVTHMELLQNEARLLGIVDITQHRPARP